MKKALVLLFLAGSLAGCQSARQPTGPVDTTTPGYGTGQVKLMECDKLLTDNTFTKKNALPYQKCVVQTKEKYNLFSSDLDKVEDYKRLELAEQYSSGKISGTQFNASLAEYEMQLNSIKMARNNARTMADAQAASANAQAQAASAVQGAAISNALQQTGNNLMMLDRQRMMNQPINTRCNTFMGTTNCQTW